MDDALLIIIGIGLGLAVGATVGFLIARSQAATAAATDAIRVASLEDRIVRDTQASREREGLLRTEHDRYINQIQRDHEVLKEQFTALAADALRASNAQFLEVADERMKRSHLESAAELAKREESFKNLVEPMRESLKKVEQQTSDADKARIETQTLLAAQIHQMMERSDQLGKSTDSLRNALRRPEVRGRWGELHLRRVVEVAGLINGVDFDEQTSQTGGDGSRLRPDMIVTLSGGRIIVVDAKTPLDALLDMDTDPEHASDHAARHVQNVRKRVKELSAKAYREQFGSKIDFSVLFLPAESFLQVATEQDPRLLTDAYEDGVIIATPTVLVAILRTVAHTWRTEALAHNAQEVLDTGQELYKRLSTMGDHLARLGKAIGQANDAYNKTIGSMERQVLPQARRFAQLQQLEEPKQFAPVTVDVRSLSASELVASTDTAGQRHIGATDPD